MLANQHFYHKSIRAYTVLFGSLFNGMQIVRQGGGKTEKVPVPVSYSSGQAYLKYSGERDAREKDIPRVSKILPALVFSLTSFAYDPMRKTNARERISHTTTNGDGSTVNFVFGRVPFDFEYELAIKTKNMDDMLQLVEQIIPYFDPVLVVTMKDAPGSNLAVDQDVKILLTNVQIDDIYEGNLEDHRMIECTMNFTLKGYLYKRSLTGASIDKLNFSFTPDADDLSIESMFSAKGEETFVQEAARELNNSIEEGLFGVVNTNAGLLGDPNEG
uniref:Tail sheath stabilizer and completion protein n=1 Tax=Pseudomonas phage Cygsa01 TaxID=3138529 RepID=A0AAU6W409_9VIRU